jgi:hypothetical protein
MRVVVENRSRPVHREYIKVSKVSIGEESKKMLQISLLCLGDPKHSLLQHFLQFYSSAWVGEGKLNRFFILAVQYYFLSDRHLPASIKKTEEVREAVKDIIQEIDAKNDAQLKLAVESLC